MKSISATIAILALIVFASACGDDDDEPSDGSPSATTGTGAECGTESGEGCAPADQRVDLETPVFTNPTEVTNPLFPVSQQHSVLFLGESEGEPLRVEVTLLPETKAIEWNGSEVEALITQYAAYQDGRLHEIALDFFAQADDGSVWTFGEDVYFYEDGALDNSEGTWLAGKDGPPGMIMPASPEVGDVYRPEDVPGIGFEEVTVKSVGQTVDGPRGPVEGAIVVTELHDDNTTEDKTFAPGYGEFIAGTEDDGEKVALAVPTDAADGAVPPALSDLAAAADAVFESVRSDDWDAASTAAEDFSAAWETYKAGDVPPVIETAIDEGLEALNSSLSFQNPIDTQQAAIDLERWAFDLQLQHRPPAEVDVARLDILAKQTLIDSDDNEEADAFGNLATMDWVRNRFAHAIDSSLLSQIDGRLRDLRSAASTEDLGALSDAASGLRETLGAGSP
jgi:hypothetical protein